jgi:hypothetical protein
MFLNISHRLHGLRGFFNSEEFFATKTLRHKAEDRSEKLEVRSEKKVLSWGI